MELCTAKEGGDLTTDLKKIMDSLVVLPWYARVVLTLPMCVVKPPYACPCFSVISAHFLHGRNPFHVLPYVK